MEMVLQASAEWHIDAPLSLDAVEIRLDAMLPIIVQDPLYSTRP